MFDFFILSVSLKLIVALFSVRHLQPCRGAAGCRYGVRWRNLWLNLTPGKIVLANDPTFL